MKILMALTYYRPHYSGLTIYTERLARALVQRGHQVTILTSRNDPKLPAVNVENGVVVRRLKVMMRISKGVIMPSMPFWAIKLLKQSDAVIVHVPQLDAAPISLSARLLGKPVILTYHCDLRLPKGFIHWLANRGSNLANHLTASMANIIMTNTQDYADHSNFLQPYLKKVEIAPPPVELPEISEKDVDAFREKYGIQRGQPVIGMAARLAVEKGAEYLAEAMPMVLQKHPNARVFFVGQYLNVLGEEVYAQKIDQMIGKLGGAWKFLGILPTEELAAFFKACSVTVLPSLNSTESFGMVQIESMISGTPVVASDIPGVRQPVLMTGMGRIVPARNAPDLSAAIIDILDHPDQYGGDSACIAEQFSPYTISGIYEKAIMRLIEQKKSLKNGKTQQALPEE